MTSWGRFFREIGSVLTGRKEEEKMESCGDPSYRREKERSWRVTTENSDKSMIVLVPRAEETSLEPRHDQSLSLLCFFNTSCCLDIWIILFVRVSVLNQCTGLY